MNNEGIFIPHGGFFLFFIGEKEVIFMEKNQVHWILAIVAIVAVVGWS